MTTAKSTASKVDESAKQTKPKKKPGRKSTKVKLPEGLIPIEEETWLLAPLTLTLMRHNYTSVQNKVLMSILECLQDILRKILDQSNGSGGGVRDLSTLQRGEIANEKGGLSFNLDFKTFGIDRNHYNELRSSLRMLPSIPVEIPFKSKEGKRYIKVTSLCDVFIPEEKYKTYVVVHIDKEVAEKLVSFELGWHRLGKEVVTSSNNKYTQRIYMYITAWTRAGRSIMSSQELRKWLQLEDKYREFRKLAARVLDPAQKELEELAKAGYCDCYFTYQKKYSGSRKSGEPDQIEFHIFKSPKLAGNEEQAVYDRQYAHLQELIMKHFGFTQQEIESLMKRVNEENVTEMMTKVSSIYMLVKNDKKGEIKDIKAYVYKAMDNFLKETEMDSYEEIKD